MKFARQAATHGVEYAAFVKWMNERFGSQRELAKLKELLKHQQLSTGVGNE